jgi:hypothetical protein
MKQSKAESSSKRRRPALSPESRENQLISYATDLAEKQLIEGTASSQVITHFLKLGTTKMQLEKEKLANENELLRAKKDAIQSDQKNGELYENAINAFKKYSGHGGDDSVFE